MAGKSVSFNANCNLSDSYIEEVAKWLSCNGEVWGVGPTLVFAAAAALFLHHEVEASVLVPGDHPHVTLLEKTLVSAMVVGTLALMVHIWVCLMRFFQYYLDTLIRDSPNVLLEMTTAGLLGSAQSELAALGPLTRFLRQQQPQIHITACWLLALCYADYIRKHYCTRFNMPYMDQWQADLHEVAGRRARGVLTAAHSFAAGVRTRLRGLAPPPTSEAHTVTADKRSHAADGGCASGCTAACGGGGGASAGSEALVQVTDACDQPGEDLQKMRAYIKATRCLCSGAATVQKPQHSSGAGTPERQQSSGALTPKLRQQSGAATPERQRCCDKTTPKALQSSDGNTPEPRQTASSPAALASKRSSRALAREPAETARSDTRTGSLTSVPLRPASTERRQSL